MCFTTSVLVFVFYDGCMALLGEFEANASASVPVNWSLKMPGVYEMGRPLSYIYRLWLWHGFTEQQYLDLPFFFPFPSFYLSSANHAAFARLLHHPLSSSSSWPSYVRKVPFLPLLSRHAYALIRKMAFYICLFA